MPRTAAPGLGEHYLFPLLRNDPQLAIGAGSPALTALAAIPTIPVDILTAIEGHLPEDRHINLDVGAAAITQRLVDHYSAHTRPTPQARPIFWSNSETGWLTPGSA